MLIYEWIAQTRGSQYRTNLRMLVSYSRREKGRRMGTSKRLAPYYDMQAQH
ncbi:protein of unknown function [Microbacterium sp. Nx66]|nr:protein of unknown function [Microbacterium sp. Nx66]